MEHYQLKNIFDSHRGNVNNFGDPKHRIINITSGLSICAPTGEMLIILKGIWGKRA